ncbi:hypothetical protein CB1_000750001 [Camelus ferus]|nr:hypothetical protein CB1_000750001 [Camelus ferus]
MFLMLVIKLEVTSSQTTHSRRQQAAVQIFPVSYGNKVCLEELRALQRVLIYKYSPRTKFDPGTSRTHVVSKQTLFPVRIGLDDVPYPLPSGTLGYSTATRYAGTLWDKDLVKRKQGKGDEVNKDKEERRTRMYMTRFLPLFLSLRFWI